VKAHIGPAIKAHLIRGGFYVVLILTGTVLVFLRPEAPAKVSHRTLTFAERIGYQRAIEDVCWRHRIWPKANAAPKPPLDKVMSQAQIERKVEDYLRDSQALEDYWQRPITPEQLQAEMERMASHTKQPGVLHELFAALGNDPFVIAECLARPVLAERLLTELYAHDPRFHGELKRRAEAELRAHGSVRQMKQTSGMYTEIELVKSDSAYEQDSGSAERGVKLTSREWDESVGKLAEQFRGSPQREAAAFGVRRYSAAFESADMSAQSKKPAADKDETLPVGKLSPLQEDDAHYYAVAVMKKGKDRLKLATLAWLKEPLRSWLAKAEAQVPVTMAAVGSNYYTLPVIGRPLVNSKPSGTCTDDTWTPTSLNGAPDAREQHTAVWTGSEMIVWGGLNYTFQSPYLNTGGRYNPSTDSWTATSTFGAPARRAVHTAVWTGSEMIIWGGSYTIGGYLNAGGRYNPGTDSWTPTSLTNAPAARYYHTAVWTGSEMIVWGGYNVSNLNTGGRYNPSTDSWTATSTTNAPAGREYHTAAWTGSQMIVWGGYNGYYLNTGGRYNPSTDSWTAANTTNAPSARYSHTAVWTNSEMIVWGGFNGLYLNTGGRYNPSTDSWTATGTTGAPSGRYRHTAVWTSGEMIVWGGTTGVGSYFNTGGRYNPSTDGWTATSTGNAPAARYFHTAVWTGSQMIVWGGLGTDYLNTGGRYCATAPPPTPTPSATASPTPTSTGTATATPTASPMPTPPCIDDTWIATTTVNAPEARETHTAVWTGSEMIIWGGGNLNPGGLNTGGRYNPALDTWTATSTTNAPEGRGSQSTVWTGSELIIWGGFDGTDLLNTGGRYNPITDTWTGVTTDNAPVARAQHSAVWTGSEMIIWGGLGCGNNCNLNTGGRYNPSTDSWTTTSTVNAPEARWEHTAEWTGSEMIVWGGSDDMNALHTGGRYDPSTDSWTPTGLVNVAPGRVHNTAVWTGSEMIVWGGVDETFHDCNTGGRYNPTTDSWVATSLNNAPSSRDSHSAVWTGAEMIVWGGVFCCPVVDFNTGGRYSPDTDSWIATSTANAPFARANHSAVWTGSETIVWGGFNYEQQVYFNTGGRYCAQGGPSPTPTPTASPTPTATLTPTPTATFTPTATPPSPTPTPTATVTPTPTSTPRPSPTPRFAPTPRSRPTPAPRP
jgi:N-acetylneuraminic acid mutarotase